MSHPDPLYDPLDELVRMEEAKERELKTMRDQQHFQDWLHSLIRTPKHDKRT